MRPARESLLSVLERCEAWQQQRSQEADKDDRSESASFHHGVALGYALSADAVREWLPAIEADAAARKGASE